MKKLLLGAMLITGLSFGHFKIVAQDSLNMKLYNLINSDNISQNDLLIQTKKLIKQGAKPNAYISIGHSRRRILRKGTKYYSENTTAFHEAVYKNNVPLVAKMIALGANPNIADWDKRKPIIFPLKENNTEMAVFLFENGVDIKKVSPAYSSESQLVKKLIEMGANPNMPTKRREYLIKKFLKQSDSAMVFFLIKNGVAISSINLSDCNDVELIENLIKKGANRETIKIDKAFSDKEKLKQLIRLRGNMKNHKYIYFKKVFEDSEILDIFIENVDINTKYKTDDCPIIFKAVEYNDTIAVNKILKKGANLNLRCGKYSFNLLLFAVKEDNPEMLSFLLKKGLNANSKTNKNESALHLAVDTRNEKIINILIDAGAKLEYQGKYPSKTPLGYAVWKDEEIATKTLINRGANVNSTNKYGETPLIIAIEHQNLTIIKLLVENGANTKKAYKGKTPLRYAQSIRVSNEIIEYLKLH